MSENKDAPKEQDDQKNRVDAFVKEYGELVEKHNVDFANYPAYIPDGNGGFRVIVQTVPVDVSKQPKKSPFIA